MFKRQDSDRQGSLWIANSEIPRSAASTYYKKLNAALEEVGFSEQIRAACRPYYKWEDSRGRKGIDPVVYFKMLMVGFFENIGSERGIAARCGDSISIRDFLHYDLTERTPNHSSLTRVRQRLEQEVFDKAFSLLLGALVTKGLLKGKKLGIDTSVIEANASMRTIVHRQTGENYRQYVERLAAEAGEDCKDEDSLRRFDRKRKNKKVSNTEWHNPHDKDAKIGPTKQGKIKMIHKVEHVVDMQTGAIVAVDTLDGDQSDSQELADHIFGAQDRVDEALGRCADEDSGQVDTMVADRGYFSVDELGRLQQAGIRTVVEEPAVNRNMDKLDSVRKRTIRNARRSATSKYGRRLKRRRGELLERSFTHAYDNAGLRRATLRGLHNLRKRHTVVAMCCNISLLMRAIIGVGTPKQVLALALAAFVSLFRDFLRRFAVPSVGQSVHKANLLTRTWSLQLPILSIHRLSIGSCSTAS